jgi:choline dehydrogenase
MIPRGKGLGGSSQINYMLHFNGIEQDFENWSQLGATDWNYNNMKYWLHRHQTGDTTGDYKGACKDVSKLISI